MTRPRILMADDHSIVLAGLKKLVETEGEVVGTVEDGRALVGKQRSSGRTLFFWTFPCRSSMDWMRRAS